MPSDRSRPMQNRLNRWGLDLAWCLLLFGLGWWLRGTASSTFVTWDEPAWVYRSVAFLAALARREWALTLQVGHPGVLTMWSGALSLAWHEKITGLVTPSQLEAILAIPWQVHNVPLLRQLDALLPLAKGGLIFLHNILLVGLYLLLKRLIHRPSAILASAFLLADPFYLALVRVLHLDALTSTLMLAAFLAGLLYSFEGKRRDLLLAAFLSALALLTKTYALFAVPCLVGLWFARFRGGGRPATSRWALDGVLALLTALGTYIALWPALWASPREALRAVFGLSLQYAAEDPAATAAFFRGQVVEQVGPVFYAAAVWFRSTPLTLIGAVLGLVAAVLPKRLAPSREHRLTALALAAYALFYLVLIGLGLKKFDRYALPALLSLDVLAALGWCWAAEEMFAPLRMGTLWAKAAAFAGLAIQSVFCLGPLYPTHYLAYYNPLAGGLPQAIQTLPVGWGEGIERAAQVLASRPDAPSTTVATWAVAGLAASYPGPIVPFTSEALPQADLALLYIADLQAPSPQTRHFWGKRTPLWVGSVAGQEYVWIYENDYGGEVLHALAQSAQPGDLVVSNLPSRLERLDRSGAAWLVPLETDEIALSTALTRAYTASAIPQRLLRQVFLLTFDAETARGEILRRLVAENGLLTQEIPFEYGTMRIYRLIGSPSFQPPRLQHALQAQVGQELMLEGYGLAQPAIQYRQELGLALQWRALRSTPEDWHISLQIVDDAGNIWGQRDFPLQDALGRGTASWEAGQAVLTHGTIPLDAGTPPGDYYVRLRVYALSDLQPLPIVPAEGAKLTNALILGAFQVQRAEIPPTPDELPASIQLNAPLAGRIEVLGYTLGREAVQSGEEVPLVLFWRALHPEGPPFLFALSLQGEEKSWPLWQGVPLERYPTAEWVEGDILRYPYRVRIPPDVPTGQYRLTISLLNADTGAPLAGEPVPLGRLDVTYRERVWQAPPIEHPQRAELGRAIALLGYDIETAQAHPGGIVGLTLYWQSLQAVERDYHVFTHLVDSAGQIYGQKDGLPAQGERPTSGWVPGEIVIDPYEIPIRTDAPDGEYRLLIGMYDPSTGERLPVITFSTGQVVEEPERRILLDRPIALGKTP